MDKFGGEEKETTAEENWDGNNGMEYFFLLGTESFKNPCQINPRT